MNLLNLTDISGLHIQSPESSGPRPKSEYEAGPSGTIDIHTHQPGLPIVPGPNISENQNFGSSTGSGSSSSGPGSSQHQPQQATQTIQHHPPAGSTGPFNHGSFSYNLMIQLC